jgi:hypothetical protein
MLSNAVLALQYAGLFEEPVCAPELSQVLACERRRCDLLAAHLQTVLSTAPEHAEPHRAALDDAGRRVAWLERRIEEERVIDAWRRANPPTAAREVRAILYYLGLGRNPFPAVPMGPTTVPEQRARAA